MKGSWRLIVAVAATACTLQTHAALIPDSQGLYDQATGLEWLRVDTGILRGISWEEAQAAVPGYRLATIAETQAFFADAHIEGDGGDGVNADVQWLLDHWGTVDFFRSSMVSRFWLADAGPDGSHAMGVLGQSSGPLEPPSWAARPFSEWALDGDITTSAALVRQASVIPEPASASLLLSAFGFGAAAMAVRARRRPSPVTS